MKVLVLSMSLLVAGAAQATEVRCLEGTTARVSCTVTTAMSKLVGIKVCESGGQYGIVTSTRLMGRAKIERDGRFDRITAITSGGSIVLSYHSVPWGKVAPYVSGSVSFAGGTELPARCSVDNQVKAQPTDIFPGQVGNGYPLPPPVAPGAVRFPAQRN